MSVWSKCAWMVERDEIKIKLNKWKPQPLNLSFLIDFKYYVTNIPSKSKSRFWETKGFHLFQMKCSGKYKV